MASIDKKRTADLTTEKQHLSCMPTRRMHLSLNLLPKASVADDSKSGEFQCNCMMFRPKFRLTSMQVQVLQAARPKRVLVRKKVTSRKSIKKVAVCWRVLTDLDNEIKDLRKWYHDLHMKVANSNVLIKTSDCKIERLKEDKNKFKKCRWSVKLQKDQTR